MEHQETIVIVGGGAAGLTAAWRASGRGKRVILLEKNRKVGIKILISGGGKCNITNGSSIRTMLKQFRPIESRFLKFSFHSFTNEQLLELLRDQGVETYVRENGKVFPKSHNADDVVGAFQRLLTGRNVDIRTNSPVKNIEKSEDGTFVVATDREKLQCSTVIVATGGLSYQKTGTTGDGLTWAQRLGHAIIPVKPALAPIYLSPTPPPEWQGTPIRDCLLSAECGGSVIARWQGDLLFTHLGVSGPAVLEISKEAFIEFEQGKRVTICVDFFPEYTIDDFQKKILNEIGTNINRSIATLAEQLIPTKLAPYVLLLSEIDETTKLHQLKKEQRERLVRRLKHCPIGTVRDIPLDRGEVTTGGVSLNEVNPTTMESRIVPGVFFCGEILDIAGPVGGYNLQAAFSTGYVAGELAGISLNEP
jgi:hypothetical protein